MPSLRILAAFVSLYLLSHTNDTASNDDISSAMRHLAQHLQTLREQTPDTPHVEKLLHFFNRIYVPIVDGSSTLYSRVFDRIEIPRSIYGPLTRLPSYLLPVSVADTDEWNLLVSGTGPMSRISRLFHEMTHAIVYHKIQNDRAFRAAYNAAVSDYEAHGSLDNGQNGLVRRHSGK
jgi:hypothetical protein